ncbi:MAG: hypothetical protein QOJ42_6961, partial [Acidobacteriaceae bacterium]|nr:hypothetical protein [Acidobacteriaceae bacterium]
MCGRSSRSGNAGHGSIHVVIEICPGKRQRLERFHRGQRDPNTFSRGLIALGGNAADGDQHIRLRIVCCRAPASDGVGNDGKAGRLADLSFKVTVYVDDLAGAEIQCLYIHRIKKENPAPVKDAPIAI